MYYTNEILSFLGNMWFACMYLIRSILYDIYLLTIIELSDKRLSCIPIARLLFSICDKCCLETSNVKYFWGAVHYLKS